MQILKPVTFQVSQLISSNAIETYPAWSSATTYAKDAFVDYGTHIYQSLVNSNLNKQPDTNPTDWILVGPDNTHAMFDNQVSTQTSSSTPLNVTVAPGVVVNSLALLNIEGGSNLSVVMKDGASGPTVYSQDINLDATEILDWYMYFFEPYDFKSEVVITDIPAYSNGYFSISLSGSGSVKLGHFVYGTSYTLGGTQYGASSGIRDYSVKDTDQYGNTTFVERAYSKRMEASVFMDNADLNFNMKLLSSIRAIPCVWIGSTDNRYNNALIMFGFYKDFSITINYPTYSLCSVSVEGLI